ncbi:MAG TPA: hypothetical protein VFK02_18105 [Kofleriaceae bacterium]|nr:hypothetical protein [Kofleriaceae bacterium]
MRWVWRGSALAAVLIGWVFIAWQNHLHITAPVVFVCLGYLAVVATVYNLWRTGAAAVASGDEESDSTWAKPAGALGELEREKRTLLKAIKEAEFDHQMGKLSQRDVDDMIRMYRARAIEVIKEIDRFGGGAAGTTREQIMREVRARLALDARPQKKAEARPAGKADARPTEKPADAAGAAAAGAAGAAAPDATAGAMADGAVTPGPEAQAAAAAATAATAATAAPAAPAPAAPAAPAATGKAGKAGKGKKKAGKEAARAEAAAAAGKTAASSAADAASAAAADKATDRIAASGASEQAAGDASAAADHHEPARAPDRSALDDDEMNADSTTALEPKRSDSTKEATP